MLRSPRGLWADHPFWPFFSLPHCSQFSLLVCVLYSFPCFYILLFSCFCQIKSNQIALLAKAPLIRSTGAPSTGLQLPNMEQYNAYKQEVKKTLKTHNAVKMSIVQVSFEIR